MENLVLHVGTKHLSSWSLRPWLALKATGLRFEEVVIQLDSANTKSQIMAVSPSGRVPVLHHGNLAIWDSLAICEYVNELAPSAQLWPKAASARALARSVAAEMHSGFAALRNHCPMNLRQAPTATELPPDVQLDVARIKAIWQMCLDSPLRDGDAGTYLFGHFSIADAMFAPVVTRFRSYAIATEGVAKSYVKAVWDNEMMQQWVTAAL